jgi:hypothetical protein
VDGAVVETQEGYSYPASFYGAQLWYGSEIPPRETILGTGTPLPPGFRTLGTGSFDGLYADSGGISVTFKVPAAAHPTSIRIPNVTSTIDLTAASGPSPQIPTDHSPEGFLSIKSMSGQQLISQPGGITITATGECINWDAGLYNTRCGGFVYKVVNSDKFSVSSAVISLPTVVVYFSNGRIQISGPDSLSWGIMVNYQKVNVSALSNNQLSFSIGPGLDDTLNIPYYDWNNGLKPLFLMVIPPGTSIKQGMATPTIYSTSVLAGTNITDTTSVQSTTPATDLSATVVNLALSQVGKTQGTGVFQGIPWVDSQYTYCDKFVSAVLSAAFNKPVYSNYASGYVTAYAHYLAQKSLIKQGTPPKGAIVYYGPTSTNENCGHVGIADGNGNLISVYTISTGVKKADLNSMGAPILGWLYPGEYFSTN